MRLLGYLFILLSLGALALDYVAMMDAPDGGFQLRALRAQLNGLGVIDLASIDQGFMATVLNLPGAIVLAAVGVVLWLLSSLLFRRG